MMTFLFNRYLQGKPCRRCGSRVWKPTKRKRFYTCERGHKTSPTAGTTLHRLRGLSKLLRYLWLLTENEEGIHDSSFAIEVKAGNRTPFHYHQLIRKPLAKAGITFERKERKIQR